MLPRLAGVVWVWTFLLSSAGGAAPALTTAAQVKHLSAAQAGEGRAVLLRGAVTQVIPEWWAFSLEDATEGIYVATGAPLPAGLQVGQAVVVEGQTAPGNFAPAVRASSLRILGPGRMPPARPVSWQQLATGACDNEYVEVQGVVRSAVAVAKPAWEWPATALRLDIGGNLVWAYLRDSQPLPREPLVDGSVRVRGVCLVFANSQRQFQGSALSVGRAADLQVLQAGPRDQFEAPLQPIRRLFGFRPGLISFHRVKVQGIATLQVPGRVYVQQGSDGMPVLAASAPVIRPGDRVEAVGFPAIGGFSTVLEDALVRVTGHGADPPLRELPAGGVLRRVANAPAVPNALLVRVAGRLLDRTRSAQDETLILSEGGTNFSARLRAPAKELESLELGSRLAVSGVCTIQVDDRGLPQSFELLLRSPGDIQVLQRPPWLSRRLALQMAAALLAFLTAAVAGLAFLRRRVATQTETIRSQFELQASLEQRYSLLVENASDLVYVRDLEGRLLQVNRGAEELTGYTRQELLGMNVLDLLVPDERERAREELTFRPGLENARSSPEWRFRTKDGRELIIETKQRLLMENGQAVRAECIGRDITARQHAQAATLTERNRLEEQLHHSQKLESVGLLAGGVAHDFNNMLTVISGYTQLVLDDLPLADPLREPLGEISHAADRAGALTRQLLLFSRRQAASPRTISLNELVQNLEKMLRRLIREDITLTLSLEARGGWIHADPGHIEQVVMNLAVNARDAMPEGGSLVIQTRDFHVDQSFASLHLNVTEGDYVRLDVTDTGVGMPPEVRTRIFEPFFTTKEQGKGTGLGLSMVYGIVKQSGGAIVVHSEPGRGARFEILFPAATPPPESEGEQGPPASGAVATETILVAEDEAGVRSYIRDVLRSHGYTVLESANGREALRIAAEYPGPIHLLLTDVVMPEMGGVVLAERFAQHRPGTPVLLMSGYTEGLRLPVAAGHILEKPFAPAALLLRVRAMLAAVKAGGAGGAGR